MHTYIELLRMFIPRSSTPPVITGVMGGIAGVCDLINSLSNIAYIYIYIYIHTHIHICCVYIYIYIYI